MNPANDNQRKLKATCLTCGRTHTEAQMIDYLDRCEKFKKNPLDAPNGGINCATCTLTMILDMAEEGNETLGDFFTSLRENPPI